MYAYIEIYKQKKQVKREKKHSRLSLSNLEYSI